MRLIFTITLLIVTWLSLPGHTQDRFIKIQGHQLFAHTGGKGTATVIFVSGAGEDHSTWGDVEPAIGRYARTVSYDRSGLGKSDTLARYKKDASSMADELYQLLRAAKIHGPYILTGHSIGCQVVRIFAARHPDLIKGILFIDPGFDEDGLKRVMPARIWKDRATAIAKYTPAANKAQRAEIDLISLSCKQAEQASVRKSIPVILLTATKVSSSFPGSGIEAKFKMQTHLRWLNAMRQAVHIVVPNARHYVQNEAPEIVTSAVIKLSR